MNETVGQRARRNPPPRSHNQPPVSSPLPARTRPFLSLARQSQTLNLTWLSLRVKSVSSRGPYSAVINLHCLSWPRSEKGINHGSLLGRPASSERCTSCPGQRCHRIKPHTDCCRELRISEDEKGLTTLGPFLLLVGERVGGTVRGTDMNNSSQEHSPR